MKLDILAFGAHPDDVELSCAGILLVEKKSGKRTGVIDLTPGELGTRGSVEDRKNEASEAGKILGADVRENLFMADGFFKNDESHQKKIIGALRKYRPEIVLCNAPEDRHPDHGRSSALVTDAAFLSGLRKIVTEENNTRQTEWRPKYVFHYIQDRLLQPNFVVDITEVFDEKIEAIRAHKTQFFDPSSTEPETYISTPDFLDSIIYRAKTFGKMIGVKYAEGLVSKKMIGIRTFDALLQFDT
ncbi:MAG: bacillithiol biosynthesis deacetylase BshB1 [Ginsengibacter sp.]